MLDSSIHVSVLLSTHRWTTDLSLSTSHCDVDESSGVYHSLVCSALWLLWLFLWLNLKGRISRLFCNDRMAFDIEDCCRHLMKVIVPLVFVTWPFRHERAIRELYPWLRLFKDWIEEICRYDRGTKRKRRGCRWDDADTQSPCACENLFSLAAWLSTTHLDQNLQLGLLIMNMNESSNQ